VLPGDRLGLFFATVVPAVYYGYDPVNFNDGIAVPEIPKINDTLKFPRTLPVNFVAAGFVNISKYGLINY